eukprot:4869295-Pleurochrysis_carterae.AAC.7
MNTPSGRKYNSCPVRADTHVEHHNPKAHWSIQVCTHARTVCDFTDWHEPYPGKALVLIECPVKRGKEREDSFPRDRGAKHGRRPV